MKEESPIEAAQKVIKDQEKRQETLENLLLNSKGEATKELRFALEEKGPVFKAIQTVLNRKEQITEELQAKRLYRLRQETWEKLKNAVETNEEEKLFFEMDQFFQRRTDLQEQETNSMEEWVYKSQSLQEQDLEEDPVLFKPNFLTKGDIHFIVGKAGIGKSYLATQLALRLKSGEDFLGMQPLEKQKVAYLCFEDTKSRFLRRVKSIGETPEGEMHLFTNISAIGSIEKGKLEITPQGKQLVKKVQESGCSTLVIDTYAQAFLLDDGDNGSAQKVGNFLKKSFPGMTILIIHHPRKTEEFKKVDEITIDTVRGASAIVGYARSVFYLHKDERGYHLVSLKSNYGQPFPGYQSRILLSAKIELSQGKQVFKGFSAASEKFAGTEAHS